MLKLKEPIEWRAVEGAWVGDLPKHDDVIDVRDVWDEENKYSINILCQVSETFEGSPEAAMARAEVMIIEFLNSIATIQE